MRSTNRRADGVGARHLGLVFVAMLLGACADVEIHAPDWKWDGDWGEARNTDFAAEASFDHVAAPAPTVSLSGVAGSVEVVGSSAATAVRVGGIRRVRSDSQTDAERRLADLRVDLRVEGETLFVETRQPNDTRGRTFEVEYRVTVPEGTSLDLRHVSGQVEVRSVKGDVDVTNVAGSITFDDLRANVRAAVMAGSIRAAVAIPRNGVVELMNSSGDILLSIPTNTSASLRATTVTGEIRLVDLDLADEDPRRTVLRGTLAGGEGSIVLGSVAGDVEVKGVSPPQGG